MSEGVRVIGPDRAQLRWDLVDLDSQLPDDHRARLVWAFVEGLDLSEFYDRIKARDAVAGRPATDPQVVLAVWLYATLEGIGSARAIDRLCRQQKLAELVQEQAARAKTHAKEEAEKGEPKVSVSDPEARAMRLADGAVAPAWNVQVATANGFIMAIDPTDRRKDGGLAPGLVATIAERCGRAPQRLLADTTAMTREDIVKLAERYPDVTVYS